MVYVFLLLLCLGKLIFLFLWEISNISNQLKLQVLPGNFIDSKPIRNSLVSFYIYLGMSMPAHHHQKTKEKKEIRMV